MNEEDTGERNKSFSQQMVYGLELKQFSFLYA